MPVDKPKAGETQDEYLAYCIPQEINNGMEQDQAVAVCISYYDADKMSKIKDTSTKVIARVNYNTKFRGINLFAEGGLEDACWEGYIAIGTKDMDGREVPNCVPIKEEMEAILSEKGINLAEEDGSYPWDECIADQTARYGDEETAKKVCGYIKSEYGS